MIEKLKNKLGNPNLKTANSSLVDPNMSLKDDDGSSGGLPETKTTTNGYDWKSMQDIIASKTSNSKAELQSALQKANAGANNYLKALGLQGSGAGMSTFTDIATNYQNALANVNLKAEQEAKDELNTEYTDIMNSGADSDTLQSFRDYYKDSLNTNSLKAQEDKYRKDLADEEAYKAEETAKNELATKNNQNVELLKTLLDNGGSYKKAEEFIANSGGDNQEYLTNLLNAYGVTYDREAEALASRMNELIDDTTTSSYVKEKANKLLEALNDPDLTKEKYEQITKQYEQFIANPNTVEEKEYNVNDHYNSTNSKWIANDDQVNYIVGNNKTNGSTVKLSNATSSSFTATNGDAMIGQIAKNGENTKQNKYANAIIDAAKNNKIPNGAIIDMNYGWGESYYVYSNGAFYKIGSDLSGWVKANKKSVISANDKKVWESLKIDKTW